MRKLFQWTSWCLLFVFPTTMVAANGENVAMLSGSGTVRINGAVSPQSSTVFAGDKVVTAKDSGVTLTSKGRTVTLPENSSLTYSGKRVRLDYGRVFISAQPGTEAQLGNLTISPKQAGAKMEMQSSGKKMVLIARAGSLLLTDGANQMTLESGQTLMTADSEPSGAGYGVPAAALGSGAIWGTSGWIVIGAGMAAVGTAGGLTAAGVFGGGGTSPSRALSPSKP